VGRGKKVREGKDMSSIIWLSSFSGGNGVKMFIIDLGNDGG